MAKRFTDTEKYKKAFIRTLPGAYKLLWDYLYHDCNHAGVWEKDFEVAQIRVGTDMAIDEQKALKLFNLGEDRIILLSGGRKWFIRPFTEFQYGPLNPENRVHLAVLNLLKKEGLCKPLISSLQGAMEKEKDKEKEKDLDREPQGFAEFWLAYPKRRSRGAALKAWRKINPSMEQLSCILHAIERAKISTEWLKDSGQFIPHPASWLNAAGWEDEYASANGTVGVVG